MLAGPLFLRLRPGFSGPPSSRNQTSSCQCRAFSISQGARAVKTSGCGPEDLGRRHPGQGEMAGLGLHFAIGFPAGLDPAEGLQAGEFMLSASPLAETTMPVRVSLRPCPTAS